jgi:hypothetical protein
MDTRNSPKPITWRQLLKKHGHSFLRWLRDGHREQQALERISAQLADFLITTIERSGHEWPDAPVEFWNRIPDVRSCCSDVTTFEKPFAVEAYAYVHLLERYRRTWAALKYLSRVAALPLGSRGVRVLDIGTGPAPALYAIDDFYATFSEFARDADVPELQVPQPELSCVERSQPMVWFFHAFSEFASRRGPFGPAFSDFAGLDLAATRMWHQRQNEVEQWWDEETQQYEEIYDTVGAAADAERLFRYRLVVLSNFLTLDSEVEQFEKELRMLFEDLKAGGVVMVLGATGDSYQRVYKRLTTLALDAGLGGAAWHTDALGDIEPGDEMAHVIKAAQYRVYRHIEQLVSPESLKRDNAWPDYWDPKPSPKARPRFALRVFRSGRWPTTKSTV